MGQLINGVWHDTWYDTKSTGVNFNVRYRPFVTGSPPMARLVLPVKADLPLKKIAITCMFRWPARGRTAH